MDEDKQLFTHESIDTDIDLLISNQLLTSSDPDAQLIYKLRHIYQEDTQSLNRVWTRLEHHIRQPYVSQEPKSQIHQRLETNSRAIPFRRSRGNAKYPANRLFTVLAATIVGLFLVSSLAWVLAIMYPATPGASGNVPAISLQEASESLSHFVQVPLLSYLNNKGIGSAPGQANFDGSGYSYPANQLPPAGQRVLNGVPYQFPGSMRGANDNVAALGQTITLPQGNYQQAFLLAATSWGTDYGEIVVHYTDGSASSESLTVYDWSIGPPGVVNTDYRYSPKGIQGSVHIYAIQIAMDRTKRANSLILPITAQPGPTMICLHVFALTLQS